jgi:biopolymer transport protein ExbB
MTFLLLATAESAGTLHSALDFLEKGGLFMIPLALSSIAGLMAILYKFLSLARSRVIPPLMARQLEGFENLIATERIEPLLLDFERGESTLARLAGVAVKHRGRPQTEIIQAVEASAREETARLHAGIGVLDVVITVAPLLGLLGTASGLVAIFQGLGETTDHLAIARGIAEALNTTIAGLAIAVPCVIAHSYFTRRIEMLTARLESLLADLAHVCAKAKPKA